MLPPAASDDEVAAVEPLSVHWEERADWPAPPTQISDLPRTETARALGELRFAADAQSASLSLGAVLPVQRRAFTLRIDLSPNALAAATDRFRLASLALETIRDANAAANLVAACAAAGNQNQSCDACLGRGGELCGFCGATASCLFGWRDGPIGASCGASWQYAACPTSDRLVLAPTQECIADGAAHRFRFALPASVATRGVASATLQLASLASPLRTDPRAIYAHYDVGYQRSLPALDGALCEIALNVAARRDVGTVAYGQQLSANVADAVRHAALAGNLTLIVEARAEFAAEPFALIGSADRSHVRAAPRLTIELQQRANANGAPPPTSVCATASTCGACTALAHCGWCDARCVDGDSAAPSNSTCAAYLFDNVCNLANSSRATLAASASCGSANDVDSELPRLVHLGQGAEVAAMVLSFDVRPLHAALVGGARRVRGGSMQLRARFVGSAPPSSPMFAELMWLVGDAQCGSTANSSFSTVVGSLAALRFAANSSVQPLDIPLTSLPIAVDALALALAADWLLVRVAFSGAVRVWSPVAANVNERLAPALVVDLAAAAQPIAADTHLAPVERSRETTALIGGVIAGVLSVTLMIALAAIYYRTRKEYPSEQKESYEVELRDRNQA